MKLRLSPCADRVEASWPAGLRHRRGFALLLVLAAVVIIVPLIAAYANVTLASRLLVDGQNSSQAADALLDASAPSIEAWLVSSANSIVLPPESEAPTVGVASVTGELDDGQAFSLTITAVDQHALPRLAELEDEHVMSAIDEDGEAVKAGLPELLQTMGTAVGWDTVAERLRHAEGTPRADADERVGDRTHRQTVYNASRSDVPLIQRVALHSEPVDRASGPSGAWRVNVSTAPLQIIGACEEILGVTIAPVVTSARSAGETPPIGSLRLERGDRAPRPDVLLTTHSDAWLFLITAEVDGVRRQRVVVYQRIRDRWEQVHSHVVRHP